MAAEPAAGGVRALERPAKLSRIEIVANERSGSVGEGAAAEAKAIAEGLGYQVTARAIEPHDLIATLEAAIASKPDLLVVIAGDGTANAAAELCGPDGPLLAPLPGGTMNMLPHALYGLRDWQTALRDILSDGRVRPVGGGEVDGHPFTVAAILGNPALWAPAREALRTRNLAKAFAYGLYAWRRCLQRKLRFTLDGAPHQRAEALALMCPLISRGIPDDTPALEAVAIDPKSFGGVLRLGLHALLTPLIGPILGGDWRSDPAVTPGQCREGAAYARRHINAILDGEPIRLPKYVTIRFKPVAFRALVPAEDADEPTAPLDHIQV